MKRLWLVVVAMILILVIGIGAYYVSTLFETNTESTTSTIQPITMNRAVAYLTSNYDSKVGLIPETTNSTSYWVYSDGFLAALALRQAGSSNSSLTAIADNVSATIQLYAPRLKGATNQYMALSSGWSGPCGFDSTQSYVIAKWSNIEINVTLNNATGTLSDSNYADIAFLAAICHQHRGDYALALNDFNLGAKFFDGTGFADRQFTGPGSANPGQYQTYKLALYIYASKLLSQPASQAAMTNLLKMQASDGGFYTGYYPGLTHGNTTTNTETTSLAILALAD